MVKLCSSNKKFDIDNALVIKNRCSDEVKNQDKAVHCPSGGNGMYCVTRLWVTCGWSVMWDSFTQIHNTHTTLEWTKVKLRIVQYAFISVFVFGSFWFVLRAIFFLPLFLLEMRKVFLVHIDFPLKDCFLSKGIK